MKRYHVEQDGMRLCFLSLSGPVAGRKRAQPPLRRFLMLALTTGLLGCADDGGEALRDGLRVGAADMASGAGQAPLATPPDQTPTASADAGADAVRDATHDAATIPSEADVAMDAGRVGELCLNGVDDDQDTLVDCDDDECLFLPACIAPEVWVIFAVPVAGPYEWELFGSSTRLPDQPVRLSGPAAPLRGSMYAFAFDWERETLFVARGTPAAFDLLAASPTSTTLLRSGTSAAVYGGSIDVAGDGESLWVGRILDATVIERIDLATPGNVGETLLEPLGRAIHSPTTRADSSHVFAVRQVRPPTPAIDGGDAGETEVVRIDAATLDLEPVAPGNVGRLTVRRETGQLYGVEWGVGLVALDEQAGQWVPVPGVPEDAFPVGTDLWVHRADAAMQVVSASLGTIGSLPTPDTATGGVQRFIAVVAPNGGSLDAFAFD